MYSPEIKKQTNRELRSDANLLGCTGILFCLFSFLLAIGIAYFSRYLSEAQAGVFTNEFYLSISTLIAVPVPFFLFSRAKGISLSRAIPLKVEDVKLTAVTIPLAMGMTYMFNIVVAILVLILSAFGIDAMGSDAGALVPSGGAESTVIYICIVSILTGIFEEICFRGIVMTSLRKYGDHFAIFATSFLFGIMHGNFVQGLSAFAFGVMMGYAVLITGSIWTSIFMHALNNFIAISSALFSTGISMSITIVYFLVGLASLVTAFILFLIFKKDYQSKFKRYKNSVLSNPKKFLTYITAPGMLVFYVSIFILSNTEKLGELITKVVSGIIG